MSKINEYDGLSDNDKFGTPRCPWNCELDLRLQVVIDGDTVDPAMVAHLVEIAVGVIPGVQIAKVYQQEWVMPRH